MKRLVGRTEIEDALSRLDRLTQDEVRMAAAQGLKATHKVDDNVKIVEGKVQGVDVKMDLIIDGERFILNQSQHNTQFYPIRQSQNKRGHG